MTDPQPHLVRLPTENVALSCDIGVIPVIDLITDDPQSSLRITLPGGLWEDYRTALQNLERASQLVAAYLSDSGQHQGGSAFVYAELAAVFEEGRDGRPATGPDSSGGGLGRGCGR